MADAPANQATVQGSLPLYKKPEPLNLAQHKGKGLKYGDRPFDFLRETHFVPLTLGEFAAAGARFPIIFIGENKTPVAAMGLQQGSNLYVDEKGMYEDGVYVPAYVRRYPFVAATHTDSKDRFTVCVDTGSKLFSDKPDEPFFTEAGEPSEFTNRAIDFVRRFEADVAATEAFLNRLKELDLLDKQQATFQPRDAQGQPAGEPQVVASYWGVSGEKLKTLEPNTLAELRDNTYLGAIYAQMLSMGQWDTLMNKAARRQNATPVSVTPGIAPASAPEA